MKKETVVIAAQDFAKGVLLMRNGLPPISDKLIQTMSLSGVAGLTSNRGSSGGYREQRFQPGEHSMSHTYRPNSFTPTQHDRQNNRTQVLNNQRGDPSYTPGSSQQFSVNNWQLPPSYSSRSSFESNANYNRIAGDYGRPAHAPVYDARHTMNYPPSGSNGPAAKTMFPQSQGKW